MIKKLLDTPNKLLARKSFGRAADSYDGAAALQQEIANRLLQRLQMISLQPERILDLGSGTGFSIPSLLSSYKRAEVVALDMALPMLHKASTRRHWLRKPKCICADGEHLPFSDNRFDLIFSNLMLQWCTDLPQTFNEINRVLRPGGLLLFTSFGPDTLKELRASWQGVDDYTHVNHFQDMHEVGDAMVRANFLDPVMDVERLTLTYPTLKALMRDLKQIGAHNVTADRPPGLTGKQRMQTLVENYEVYRKDGVLPASYEVVYGHAWMPENQVSVSLDGLTQGLPK